MASYIVRRILLAVLTVFVISFFSFVIMQLPEGDYVDYYVQAAQISQRLRVTPEVQEQLREDFGLNRPMVVQYWSWISKVVVGEFGYHFHSGNRHPIKYMLYERVSLTIVFTGFTVIITWVFALPVGIYSAVRHHSPGDYAVTFLGFMGRIVCSSKNST